MRLATRALAILALLTVLGAGLRLYRLDWQSAGTDENFSLRLADLSFPEMNSGIRNDGVHPPLHYWMLWLWMKAFGFGQFQSRLLSALLGTLTIPAIFLAARRVVSTPAALIAAALFTVSQFAIVQSQEGRMYAAAIFLTVVTVHLFLRASEVPTLGRWGAFALATTLMLATHYFTGLVLAALGLSLLFSRRDVLSRPSTWIAFSVPVTTLILWLSSVADVLLRPGRVSAAGPMSAHWFTPISSLNWFHSGKWWGIYQNSPLWSYPAGCLLFLVPALIALLPDRYRTGFLNPPLPIPNRAILALLAAVPFFVPIALAMAARTQHDVRYLSFALPGYLILVAAGIQRFASPAIKTILLAAILLYNAASLPAVYTVPYKPDYRAAAAWVVSSFQPGDCLCFLPEAVGKVPSFWSAQARSLKSARSVTYKDFIAGVTPCHRIWALWDNAWFRDNPHNLTTKAIAIEAARRHELLASREFFELRGWLFRVGSSK